MDDSDDHEPADGPPDGEGTGEGADTPEGGLPAENADGPMFPPSAAKGPALREHWEEMLDDMSDIADAYRESGWEVLELHPGDVTVVTEERAGFDVLVPDDEFDELFAWVADASFDEHEIYRAEAGIVFLLVVLRDAADGRAVCCPAYYSYDEAETLERIVDAMGHLRTHVRNLAEEYVTLTHEDPAEFLPAESGEADDEE